MTILLTILTILNSISIFVDVPLWYNLLVVAYSVICIILAAKQYKNK